MDSDPVLCTTLESAAFALMAVFMVDRVVARFVPARLISGALSRLPDASEMSPPSVDVPRMEMESAWASPSCTDPVVVRFPVMLTLPVAEMVPVVSVLLVEIPILLEKLMIASTESVSVS